MFVSDTVTLVRCGGRQDDRVQFLYLCDALINLVNVGPDIFNLEDTHTQINQQEIHFFLKCEESTDKHKYLSKEIIHKSLVVHGNLNVVASGITLLSNTQTNKFKY